MSLKDASAYNVQIGQQGMVFIDIGSFELYEKDTPWVAYMQFCEHFLYPLALMQYTDLGMNQLLQLYPDGITARLSKKMLPFYARCNLGLLLHLYLHGHSVEEHENTFDAATTKAQLSKSKLYKLLSSLYDAIKKLRPRKESTQWADYTALTSYTDASMQSKKTSILEWLVDIKPNRLIDLGANNGYYTFAAAEYAQEIIACDIDPNCVSQLWNEAASSQLYIAPVCNNLLAPSPAIGWNNTERSTLIDRLSEAEVDCVLSLALIHHLCITGHVRFDQLAVWYQRMVKRYLILEWVPLEDEQTQKLVGGRAEQFSHYKERSFLSAMEPYFNLVKQQEIKGSCRKLLLFEVKC